VNDLTILLLVKGRDLHTLRWMWHANRVGLKYPVLIGDGGDNPVSRRVLSDKSLFPNLNYTYLQYNDASYEDYFRKAVDVCRRAETRFVFRGDNDDFILPSGLKRAVDFLRDNPDYVWSGAPLIQFTVHGSDKPAPHLLGDLYRLWLGPAADAYQSEDPIERMRRFASLYCLQVYYAVGTRDRMLHTLERQLALNPRNFDINDIYTTFLSLFLGKHKVDLGSVIYMHQTHTSQIHSTLPDFAQRLYHNNLMGDFERLYGDLIAHGTPEQGVEINKIVRDFYARMLRKTMRDGSGLTSAPGKFRVALRNNRLARRLRLAKDFADLRARFAAADTPSDHQAAILADIAAVQETLGGPGFPAFLRQVAPECMAET